MLRKTLKRGALYHPDPDRLVALYNGYHGYRSIREAEDAVDAGEMSELELEALEEGMIERGEL
jgi:hypothetical protein